MNVHTGRRFLGDYSSDEAQFMALMNCGLTYAKQFNLRPGIALTPDQLAQLTRDMVWLVSQDITLADGSVQSVLVPQVYMRVKDGDLDGTGALLAGNRVDLQLRGDLANGGTIAGRQALQISANNIHNLGRLSADQVDLQARQDLSNLGGRIEGGSALSLAAGRDLNLSAAQVSSAGSVNLEAARDVNLGNSLSQAQKEALFSAAVQHGAGTVSKTKGADNVLERATSIAQTDAKPPSFPTYTRQELIYGQVEDQMRTAEEAKAKLITQREGLITQQLNLERQKSQLLEQGLGADAAQIQRIQSQANALDNKISGISMQVNCVTQKMTEQDQYIKDAAQYLKSQAQGSMADGEQWLKDFYQQRTQMYPAEATRPSPSKQKGAISECSFYM